MKRGGKVPAHPAPWLVSGVYSRKHWPGIRELTAISDAPVLRADGTIWQTPGYDAVTGVLYEPSEEFPQISENITDTDVQAAIARLMDVVCDFRFEREEHKVAWLTSLLTPLGRFAYQGPTPLFLIDANIRGAGKSLLTQIISRIVTGSEMPVFSYSNDSEEMRKKITAIAIAGDRLILLDNLAGELGNDALDRALTSTLWKDRILGKSEIVELPLNAVWYATGNNVVLGADTSRRIIHIRLDVLDEHPEHRSGFKYPKLLSHVSANRGILLTSALTILAAYIRAGRSSQSLQSFGSFEGWSNTIRQGIVWAGLPDPYKATCEIDDSLGDDNHSTYELLVALQSYGYGKGFVASNVVSSVYGNGGYGQNHEKFALIKSAINNFLGLPLDRTPTARNLGNALRRIRRRIFGDLSIDTVNDSSQRNGAVWRVTTRKKE